MGKPTGFKEYKRQVPTDRDPLLRILDWNEFHEHMPESDLKVQGAVHGLWSAVLSYRRPDGKYGFRLSGE